MDLSPDSNGRAGIALAVLAVLAVLVWLTMEPGKFQYLVWILLGYYAFRIILVRLRTRYSSNKAVALFERETTQVGGWERRRARRSGWSLK